MEKVFGIAMVKDEEDIIDFTIEHLVSQDLDHLIIADNLSTDTTKEILYRWADQCPDLFTILEDPEPGYYQAAKMNSLMTIAVEMGADIILPFDADEMFVAKDRTKTVASALRGMEVPIAKAEVWDFVPTEFDNKTGNPYWDVVCCEPVIKALPSVAFRYEPGCQITAGNHDVIRSGDYSWDILTVRHVQYRSLEQYKRKLRNGKAVYDATNLDHGVGTHWRLGGAKSDEQLEREWNEYVNQAELIYNPYIR